MTALLLGPLLRHVDDRSAAIWVETSAPCEVRVLGATAPTFTVHGHHYALVEISGLEPGSVTPYEVVLDGTTVWPEPGSSFPASVIRTLGPDSLRVSFGSCRRSPDRDGRHGMDALAAFAHELTTAAGDSWPSVLLMIGDQVYADELGPEMLSYLRDRRAPGESPHDEVADFEEYTQLYKLAWGEDPAVRWLLSTVPTLTIFDDHDVRDDWNTSYTWRQQMWAKPWWRRRITGGLGSYWVYQHLGNLSAADRAADPVYEAVRAAAAGGEDAAKLVDEFAERADKEPASTRWSYAHDLGRTRLIMVDSRCSRLLTEDDRAMLDASEFEWLDDQWQGDMDHLLVASSLPYLLPRAIHHAEAWNEAVAGGAWGKRGARFGEKVRQAADLEHWAAFETSFRAVAQGVCAVAGGKRGRPPASIAFLSGDVHYSYLAKVTEPAAETPIYQIVCSPLRNPLQRHFRWASVVATSRVTSAGTRALAKLARAPRPPLKWKLTQGPWFHNAIATVTIQGRTSKVTWQTPTTPKTLKTVTTTDLTNQ